VTEAPHDYDPVSVRLVGSTPTEPWFGGRYETVVLTAKDPVQSILAEDEDREIAYVQALDNDIVIGPKNVVAVAGNQTADMTLGSESDFGSVANPQASAVIASIALTPGTWDLELILELGGTLTVADEDNMQLVQGTVVLGQMTLNIETASSAPNPPRRYRVSIPNGGAAVAIQAIGNASGASAVYRAQITATPAWGNTLSQPNGTLIPARNTTPYPVRDNGPLFAGVTTIETNSRVAVATYSRNRTR
jgi:hypothetical protein